MRRAIALAAAYLIAVQTSLTAFALVVTPDIAIVCTLPASANDISPGTVPPAGHRDCTLCAHACSAMAPPQRDGEPWAVPDMRAGRSRVALAAWPAVSTGTKAAAARAPPAA